jgi:hypothetical protein
VNLGICRYAGKGQSELGMLRKLWGVFRRGNVLVADRFMCAWTEMVMLQERGVDCIFRLTSHRTADFRRGMRLGKDDHIVKWVKPTKPRSIDRKTYDALPEFLLVRECRIRIDRPGFRVRCLIIATTLLNAEEHTKDDLAQAYRARWNEEVCQADCASKYTLYQSRTHAHSERNGVVGTGRMEPETPANKTRRTTMRRLSKRLGPPPTRMAGIILFA